MIYNTERPMNFDQMVGQSLVVENLRNQSKTGSFFPVLILCGQYGSGKTTVARVIAMAANCEHKDENGNPCGKCESCRAVLNHAPEGAIEIDGATNNGVDHIRKLLEKASTLNIYKKKIFIIDEAHMMSKAAFNAMLVTLENPPDHCIFIICTTEAEALPLTITSRMPVYTFGKIPDVLIKEHVQKVAGKNQILISADAAGLIARYASGAMRNALQILEQLSKQKTDGKCIEEEDVILALGLSSIDQQAKFLQACLSGDIKTVIEVLKACEKAGSSIKIFLKDVLVMNVDLLLTKSGAEVVGTEFYLNCLKGLSGCTNADIVRVSQVLTSAASSYEGCTSVERAATEIAASFYSRACSGSIGAEPAAPLEPPLAEKKIEAAIEKGTGISKKYESEENGAKKEESHQSQDCSLKEDFRPTDNEDEVPFEEQTENSFEPRNFSGLFSGLFSGFNRTKEKRIPGVINQESIPVPLDSSSEKDKEPAKDETPGTQAGDAKKGSTRTLQPENMQTILANSVPLHGEPRIPWKEMTEKGVLPENICIINPNSEEELDAFYEAMEQEREEEEERACSGSYLDLESARKELDRLLADPGFKMLYGKARKEERDYHIYLYYDKAGLVDAMKMYLPGVEGITALMEGCEPGIKK